jgi:hypothetical protein
MRRTLLVALAVAALAATGCAKGITGPPRFISATDASVDGSFATNTGGRVVHWAQYGPTTAYGSETPHFATELDPGQFTDSVTAQLTGLQRDTVYHYRVCASDSDQQGGPGCGEDRALRTQQAACGDTVTTDIRLTGDMVCQGPGPLYTIGAAGLDINLAGHGVTGVLSPFNGPAGIVNPDGYDDVTVRNGALGGFNPAFEATSADRNRVLHVAAGSFTGVRITGGADNEIRHSTLRGTVAGGLVATGTQRLIVADSDIASVFAPAALVNGDAARVVRNTFEAIQLPVPYEDVALRVTGTGARVAENQVTGKWDGGFFVLGADHVVVDNQLSGVEGDGIFVDPFSTNVRLARNAVDGAADDGFDIQATGVRLGENSATDNGDWGIDAVPGVTDLGGNTASGNGQAAQCRNIICG